MSSTFSCLHHHIVFSTKNREPWLREEVQERLFHYLGGTVNGLGGQSVVVGGFYDHVHLLVRMRPVDAPAAFVRELKKASSLWMKPHEPAFSWQEGYAIFSTSVSHLDVVELYIRSQHEHHRVRSFAEELEALLQRHGIVYDPAYLV
ncbi:MAG: IS200/IS605 family transposase [Verrucomicrobiota bacterium JB022]|nr:IS200/IS605 family transposase [Verrucomicrobiota bacterium JB022]